MKRVGSPNPATRRSEGRRPPRAEHGAGGGAGGRYGRAHPGTHPPGARGGRGGPGGGGHRLGGNLARGTSPIRGLVQDPRQHDGELLVGEAYRPSLSTPSDEPWLAAGATVPPALPALLNRGLAPLSRSSPGRPA